jgi:hypothetical protein
MRSRVTAHDYASATVNIRLPFCALATATCVPSQVSYMYLVWHCLCHGYIERRLHRTFHMRCSAIPRNTCGRIHSYLGKSIRLRCPRSCPPKMTSASWCTRLIRLSATGGWTVNHTEPFVAHRVLDSLCILHIPTSVYRIDPGLDNIDIVLRHGPRQGLQCETHYCGVGRMISPLHPEAGRYSRWTDRWGAVKSPDSRGAFRCQ